MRSTAMSDLSSSWTTLASNSRRSANAMRISAAPPILTTCVLVTTTPSGATITPDPSEFWMRSCGMPKRSPKKRRNKGSSANGDTKVGTRARTYTLTTAGAALLTMEAKEYCAASRVGGTSRRCAVTGTAASTAPPARAKAAITARLKAKSRICPSSVCAVNASPPVFASLHARMQRLASNLCLGSGHLRHGPLQFIQGQPQSMPKTLSGMGHHVLASALPKRSRYAHIAAIKPQHAGSLMPSPRPRRMLRLPALLVLLLACGLAACGLAGCERRQPHAQGAPAPPQVTVTKPSRQVVTEWDEYVGRFVAVDAIEVRARVSGYLDAVHFRDGQLVKAGDLLFTIDRRPFEATLAQAQANLTQARANLAYAEADLKRGEDLVR